MKRQLRWVPIFGQYTIKTGMIHVDREARTIGAARARGARPARGNRQGPRDHHLPGRARAGRPARRPTTRPGIALLYRTLHVPVVPVGAQLRPLSGRAGNSSAIPARSSSNSCRRSRPGSIRGPFLTKLQDDDRDRLRPADGRSQWRPQSAALPQGSGRAAADRKAAVTTDLPKSATFVGCLVSSLPQH